MVSGDGHTKHSRTLSHGPQGLTRTLLHTAESARPVIAAAAERSSVRALAGELGVPLSALAAYVRGATGKPRGALLAAVRTYADRVAPLAPGAGDVAAVYSVAVARERAASAHRLLRIIRDSADSALGDLDALLGLPALAAPAATTARPETAGETPDETALADALERAGIPVRDQPPSRTATGRAARRSSAAAPARPAPPRGAR